MNARNKGRRGEREAIDLIKSLTDIQLEVNYSQTYGGGHDLLGGEPYAIEVKRRKSLMQGDIKQWWKQTCEQAIKVDLIPCLFYRADRADWHVVIPHADWHFPDQDFNCTITISPELWAKIIKDQIHGAQ
tara:strand:- start:4829 stop:5218 length:390 start_codon:yes stop_codon:yes gene_type:complete